MPKQGTVLLFRPVGQAEMDLIENTGYQEFPPRLPYQPIFYPVLSRTYAEQIARDWNTKDPRSGYIGYVTQFRVRADFLERYSVQTVGGSDHQEYWIPAEDLAEFNKNIVGGIRVVELFES
jgi:hypothetical protein